MALKENSCKSRRYGFPVLKHAVCTIGSAYRKPAFQPSAFRRLFIGFQPSAENQPVSMEKALDLKILQVFFKNRGENFSFLKNVEFLEFFGFTLCFRTFSGNRLIFG